MVESKFWCVFVKIVITQKQIRSTLVYIKIMYIISCTLVVQIILVKTVFTLYFLKTYKEIFLQKGQ